MTPQERRAVVARLDHAAAALKGGRLLWVDDNPEMNRPIAQLLQRAGMTVDLALSTEEALRMLGRRGYDLIITDMRRGDDGQAGLRLAEAVAERLRGLPIVVFAGHFDSLRGVHPAIFGYTVDVDEVVHYVIDVMERARFGKAS